MKKVLLSASLAIMLVAALAVTAFAAGSLSISGPQTADPGATVTITVTGSEEGTSGKVSVSGMTISSVSGDLSTPSDFVVVSPTGMSTTYTCEITASAGGTATFSVNDVVVSNGDRDSAGTGDSLTINVNSAAEPTDEPSQQPSEQPSGQPSEQPSGSAQPSGSTKPSSSVKPSSSASTGKDKLPKTGDTTMDLWTLAIVAGACAAVAVVAGKKVFSAK